MTTISSTATQALTGIQSTDTLECVALPVDLPTTTPKYLFRLTTPVLRTGDLLDIDAWARVTNNVGYPGEVRYTVGVGWYVKAYLYTNPPWSGGPVAWNISPLNGENVTVDMHHMPLHTSALYKVPAEYDGQRLTIALMADAHSTAWNSNGGGDTLDVDAGYGQLIVRRWATEA